MIVMATIPALLAGAAIAFAFQLAPPAGAAINGAAVAPKQVTVPLDEATFVSTNEPTASHNSQNYLLATKSVYRAFLKFDTSSIGSAYQVGSASLQITTISLGVTQPGVQVYAAPSDWSASTLSASNRPAKATKLLAPLFMPTLSATQLIPLTDTSTIAVTGATSFELGYNAANSNYALAKTGATAPKLVLNLVPAAPAVAKALVVPLAEATYINEEAPNTVNNARDYLLATKQTYRAFIKFDTSSIGSAYRVGSASLQITTIALVVNQPGVQVYAAPNNWSADTLTAANRPATATKRLAGLFMPTKSATQSIPLTDTTTISINAATSFEIGYEAPYSGFALAKSGVSAPKLVLNLVPATGSTSQQPTTSSTSPTSASTPRVTTTSTSARPSTATTSTSTALPATTAVPTAPAAVGAGSAAINIPPTTTHKKLVFAHYFTPYPISLDNQPPASDYYANNYLKASGEGGKFAAVGGLLRDRPIPRDPTSGNWKLGDLKTEVRQAMASGIDGFTVDILSLSGPNWDALNNLMSAAEAVSPSFKIMLMPDMTSSTGAVDAATLAARLAPLAARPSSYHLPDGRLVVAPFKGEAQSPGWWTAFMASMSNTYGIKVAFMPVFLNAAANMASYASISYGFGDWGTRNPASVLAGPNNAAVAHSLGKKWMSPIGTQDERPNQKLYDEAANTELLRASWQRATSDDADFAQLTTWNDYSEGTAFAPSTNHGYSLLDINAYYQSQFQTGSTPSVARDAIYLTHRNQMFSALPSIAESSPMVPWGGSGRTAPRNTVEALTMLTAPATVVLSVGDATYTYSAPAGVFVKTVPLQFGSVRATAARNGVGIATVASPYTVVATPLKQDLEYFAVSSLRPNPVA